VELKGDQENGTVKFLGYCPQENVLWPMLTMKEHLEVYAAVKGLRKGEAAIVISWYSSQILQFLYVKKQGVCMIHEEAL
jgi:ABC-type multidrug transport system ATPase subunit